MKKIAAVFCVIFSLVVVVAAQRTNTGTARSITNVDLEKHKQKRLEAERDYRENYDRLGFPSPEELEERRKEEMVERLELARQLRDARLEETRIKLEKERLALDAARLDIERSAASEFNNVQYPAAYGGYYGFGSGGFFGFGNGNRFRKFGRGGFFNVPLYRATPVGVFPAGTLRPGGFGPSRIRFGGGRRLR